MADNTSEREGERESATEGGIAWGIGSEHSSHACRVQVQSLRIGVLVLVLCGVIRLKGIVELTERGELEVVVDEDARSVHEVGVTLDERLAVQPRKHRLEELLHLSV